MKERIPEASENRLLQFTAACNLNSLSDRNLGRIEFDEQAGKTFFLPQFTGPLAVVDVKEPSPQPAQSIQQIQQDDERQAQFTFTIQAQRTQNNAQGRQGPAMGGP